MRDVPERHRSLRATFEHSWRLLSPQEQRAFAILSVFRGGLQPKAAGEVIDGSPDVLQSLAAKSLLRCLPSGRCEMHELLRQFAAEKLSARPEVEAKARDRHCAHYTTFLKEQEGDLSGKRVSEALAAIKPEIANVRAAWCWAVQEARLEEIERGLDSLSRYYLLTGPFQEGGRLIEQAVGRVRELVDQREQTKREARSTLGRLLTEQARFLNQQGMYEQAIAAAREAIDQARINQAIDPEAMGHLQWGRALWYQGDYTAAQSQFESASNLAQSATLRSVRAKSLCYLGNLSEHQSDYARARAYFKQALCISQEIGDQQETGRVLNGLGLVAFNQDDYTQAKIYYEQALRTSRELGDRWLESLVLSNLGNLYSSKRDFARARDYFEQGLHIQRNLGDLRSESMGLLNLGLICNRQGDFAKARTYYERSLRIQRDLGDRRNECAVLSNLGLLSHRQGDYVAAQESSRQALQLAQELGDHFLQGFALTHLGHAQAGLGKLNEAAAAYQEAVDIRHELGQRNLAIESLAGLVRVSLAQGELAHAQRQADEILAHLETGNLDRTIEPLWIYLTCYQVLKANDDPHAQEILSTAHRLLQEQAAEIGDEEVQRSFLENVAAHREIIAAFESQNDGLSQV
jgi:tetratricopeptide (TPR) repeat protein